MTRKRSIPSYRVETVSLRTMDLLPAVEFEALVMGLRLDCESGFWHNPPRGQGRRLSGSRYIQFTPDDMRSLLRRKAKIEKIGTPAARALARTLDELFVELFLVAERETPTDDNIGVSDLVALPNDVIVRVVY